MVSNPSRSSVTASLNVYAAFDMTNPDVEIAARAKEDFTQCCAWLRHFSSMWPAASAHKLFFEAGKYRGSLLVSSEGVMLMTIPQ